MLRESHRPGIEPTTCKPQVQRPTAEPPRNTNVISVTALIDMSHQSVVMVYLITAAVL